MFSLKKSSSSSPLQAVLDTLDSVILGKPEQVRLSLACVLARGHLLVEDVPGVGKTTLVKTLARVLGLESKRVQFTNDLLPADILGTAIFDNTTHSFKFHPGPVFTHILIADELNRGTPRTQSAFLQAMEERRISLDGLTRELPNPFFVVATQNPREQIGTYPLPESQLD
ncbi:MAG: AAA family ATPase, partial [Bdellovibrionales bacterium]